MWFQKKKELDGGGLEKWLIIFIKIATEQMPYVEKRVYSRKNYHNAHELSTPHQQTLAIFTFSRAKDLNSYALWKGVAQY